MSDPEDLRQSGAAAAPVCPPPGQILATFSRAHPATVSQARDAVAGQVVKITGKAGPAGGGTLRAPLSGADCVWYRSIVFREVRESGYQAYRQQPLRPLSPLAPSDLPDYGVAHRVNVRGQQLGTDRSSTEPFAISDGESTVLVDPRITDIDTNVFGINEVVEAATGGVAAGALELRGGTFGPQEVHTEWIIPVGAQVLAVGTVRHDASGVAMLVPQGEDIALVSTKPEQQVLSRNQAAGQARLPFASARGVLMLVGAVLVIAVIVAVVVGVALSH